MKGAVRAAVVGMALVATPVMLAPLPGHGAPAAKTRTTAKAKTAVPIVSEAELHALLKGHRGRPIVLHFWATWCLPCIAELPEVAAIARLAKERGVAFVAMSLDDPTPRAAEKVRTVLAEQVKSGFDTSILRIGDADRLVASIDSRWEGDIPAFFAYDTTGRMRRAFVGEMKRADFDKFVADLGSAKAP